MYIDGNKTRVSTQLGLTSWTFQCRAGTSASHVTSHMALSENSPLFEELVGIFSNIIQQQKRVLDAGQLFLSSHVCYNRPSLHRRSL